MELAVLNYVDSSIHHIEVSNDATYREIEDLLDKLFHYDSIEWMIACDKIKYYKYEADI